MNYADACLYNSSKNDHVCDSMLAKANITIEILS